MKPLRLERHERVAHLVCAGYEAAAACEYVGLSTDASNVSRLMRRPDMIARLAYFRGELEDEGPPDTSAAGLRAKMVELAFDEGTPDTVRARCLESLMENATKAGGYLPAPGEQFDESKLSPDQRRMCELYHLYRSAIEGEGARQKLMDQLATIAERLPNAS